MPDRGHGRHAAAVGGRQLVQLGLGRVLGIGQRIEVDEDRADDVLPVLAGGDVCCRPRHSGRRSSSPARLPDRTAIRSGHVVDQIQLLRAAADVLVGWVDEVDADVVLGAGPAPGLQFVHQGVVAVLVLDGVLIDAGGIDALLLGVNRDGPSGACAHQLVAVLVDGEPVEGGVHSSRMKRLSPSPADTRPDGCTRRKCRSR